MHRERLGSTGADINTEIDGHGVFRAEMEADDSESPVRFAAVGHSRAGLY
jgi:hypothetical protein